MALMLLLACISCTKDQSISNLPKLEWTDYEWISTEVPGSGTVDRIRVRLFFQDGDGNIGLEEDQTSPPFDTSSAFYYNLWVRYFEKQADSMVEIITLQPYSTRLPNLTPIGQNKILEGTIEYDLDVTQSLSDSVAFSFRIADRDLNLSNEVFSPRLPSER